MKKFTVIIAAVLCVSFLSALLGCFFISRAVDSKKDEALFSAAARHESTVILAREEGKDGWEPFESIGGLRKSYYPISEVGEYLKRGFVAVEDKIFYEHKGVDVKRTLMAVGGYIVGKNRGGASTITQQVIKNISGDSERAISRKLKEIFRALRLEKRHTKDEIYEVYLNIVPMSEGIYGVGEAARAYFGKEPSELSAAEAATLVGLTNAPTAYNPHINPERCLKKRNTVLSVFLEDGIIDGEEYEKAVESDLGVLPRDESRGLYGWFSETVLRDAASDLARINGISDAAARLLLEGGGYRIYCTADIGKQRLIEDYFSDSSNFPQEVLSGLKFAMTLLNKEGDLIASVGGVGKKNGNLLLDHTASPIIPGSTLKPLSVYAPLINEGRICWSTVLDDTPVSFGENGFSPYPKNSPSVYSGLTTVKDGIAFSKNTLAVRLCQMRGVRACYETLREGFGFTALVDGKIGESGKAVTDVATAPMALGQLSYGVTLRELTEAYCVFPSEGLAPEGRSYIKIEDSFGDSVYENETKAKRLLKPEAARLMNKLLEEVCSVGTARGIKLGELTAVAGKTGTSGGSRDKVFVGYTGDLVSGIWCGYADGKTAVSGLSKDHLEIWDEVMQEIISSDGELAGKNFSAEGLLYRAYCKDSGGLYCEKCLFDPRGDRMEYGYFIPGTEPTAPCNRHVLVKYDTEGKGIATPGCPADALTEVSLLYIPERAFPSEVFITDAEFSIRELSPEASGIESDFPYYYAALPEGEYGGITRRKKHFNRACPLH